MVMATLAILFLAPATAQEKTRVGLVNRVQADVQIKSGGNSSKAAIGTPVHLDDEIETGPGARLEVTLKDNTKLTLGENARMIVDTFVYNPNEDKAEFSSFIKGAFRFVTGRIADAKTKTVEVRTPVATMGIRGTDFWGGPIDGNIGIFLLSGEIVVRTQGGEVVLDRSGLGTTITSADEAPSAPVTWPQEKVDRAVATVTFQ